MMITCLHHDALYMAKQFNRLLLEFMIHLIGTNIRVIDE